MCLMLLSYRPAMAVHGRTVGYLCKISVENTNEDGRKVCKIRDIRAHLYIARGQWSVVSGQRSVVNGQWSIMNVFCTSGLESGSCATTSATRPPETSLRVSRFLHASRFFGTSISIPCPHPHPQP